MTPEDPDFQAERAELATVLSSEVFTRSPIVAQMLRYISERHFSGQSHEVKEYNIAVEAFGRPASFDQTRDSIVRVEAHRLRKRLQEYYAGPGANHNIQITVPAGNYVPQFIRRKEVPEHVPEPASLSQVAVPLPEPAPVAVNLQLPPAGPWIHLQGLGKYTISLSILGLLVGSFFWARTGWISLPPASAANPRIVPDPAAKPEDEVRILAGSSVTRLVDHYGNAWSGDRYFEGGDERSATPRPIAYTQDPVIFLHRRQGNFSYRIPLKKGFYEMRLYFAETVFGENNVAGGGETARVFRIRANGADLLRAFDVIADAAGCNTANIKVFRDIQPAEDGFLHLEFLRNSNELPFVNAIEIVPSKPGAIRPIRILARDAGFTDQANRLWSADRYFHGGVLVQRHDPVANTDEETLYQNERFGNFSYVIPVAMNSRYTVTMKFCEAWFGIDRPAHGGAGRRVFDVSFNGRLLLGGFDVFREADSLRALDKTFKGLEPNAQGKLIFSFTPVRNYAMVDAIEVVDEAWK